MIKEIAQIACEIEGTEGTAETLEGADVFLAFNPDFQPGQEMHGRDPVRSAFSPYAGLPGKRSARLSFDVELGGTGAAGDTLPYADALKACGVSETLVASTSATYRPASSGIPSVTLAMYMDGKIYKLWGARGTFTLELTDGAPGIIHFEFTGADWSEADGALLTSGVSYNATEPPVFMGATFTIDSYAAVIEKLTLDAGNALSLRSDASASSGHKSAVITHRSPEIEFDPENVLVATEDFLGNWRSGAQMALSAAFGSATGNTVTITAPKVQYQEAALTDREGVSVLGLKGLCCIDSGDDEWQIQIT